MTLLEVLMSRDEMSLVEAEQAIREMQDRVMEGEDPEEILYEINLEPDYVFDIIPM